MYKKIILPIIITSSIIILWCWKSVNIVETWDKVDITYSVNFTNWDVFQTQDIKEITIWSWDIIKWVEDSIIWLKQLEEKEITITPENWYWKDYKSSNVQNLTKMIFDRMWIKPEIWKSYKIWNLEGIIKWTEWNGDFQIFMLDTNPRNTYENLIFKVKIDKIIKK